jgi:D-tagatose-1,6-bisphosphate aldolase subunit GatZ/KbaZ
MSIDSPAPWLPEVIRAQKRGEPMGLYSICSANPFVLEAAMLQAKADASAVCIESTSNQVNPEGGYTGMTPADFVRFVGEIARDMDFPVARVLFGGDHLGPFPWQHEAASTAMDKARATVRDYVLAGFVKIHLDASMRCGDDPPGALADTKVSERAADLCAVAEQAVTRRPGNAPLPLYVIGTEVPVPGGEQEAVDHLAVTRVEDAERTLALHREAFARRGLDRAWERVVGLVVQPGVEFGDTTVFDYDRSRTFALRTFIEGTDGPVFEAHSTDYQAEGALRALVEDHFAILKVGPALTFAFREAVFALAEIEREWLGSRRGVVLSNLRSVLERVMLDKPGHWQRYYRGDAEELRIARSFSLSDRIRYYWAEPTVAAALRHLLTNLSEHPAPKALISQYVPGQYGPLRPGTISANPRSLIRSKVLEVTEIYARACGTRKTE